MGTCFMIQPFDGGPYDQRFKDVLSPAIVAADLEPYRVDQDPSVQVPIDDIEDGIRRADAILADITEDNPNVWYELGFAYAHLKPAVLICAADRRDKFPFDIQHRHVIRYRTDSPSSFKELSEQVSSRLRAALDKHRKLGHGITSAAVAEIEGLAQHEVAMLTTVAQNMHSGDGHASVHEVRQDMQKAGFNDLAVTLAASVLQNQGLIKTTEAQDGYDAYDAFSATPAGLDWLLKNTEKLDLLAPPPPSAWGTTPF